MSWLRTAVRLLLLGAVTAGLYGLWFLLRIVMRKPEQRRAARVWVFKRWARFTGRIIGMRVSVQGAPPVSPCFLACNHLSYVDIILLAGLLEAVFVSRADVEHWPALGRMSRRAGTIYIDRALKRDIPRVNREIEAALRAGDTVVVFPEGTSTKGAVVQPFKASLLEPAAQGSFAVCCAALSYRTPRGEPPASSTVCWWGDMPFASHLFGLLKLSHFDATLTFAPEPIADGDRKVLAEKLWQAVAERFPAVL